MRTDLKGESDDVVVPTPQAIAQADMLLGKIHPRDIRKRSEAIDAFFSKGEIDREDESVVKRAYALAHLLPSDALWPWVAVEEGIWLVHSLVLYLAAILPLRTRAGRPAFDLGSFRDCLLDLGPHDAGPAPVAERRPRHSKRSAQLAKPAEQARNR